MTELAEIPSKHEALTAAAIELLESEGPQAVTTRKVSARVGLSSMAVYSEFGSLAGLVASVVQEGFRSLARAFEDLAPTQDPVRDLWQLGLAYRSFALARPHLYATMFAANTPGGHRRSGPELGLGIETFQTHAAFAQRAIEADRLRDAGSLEVALQLWAAMHGLVMLELAGYFASVPDPIDFVVRPGFITSMVGLGDSPDAARESCEAR